MGQTPVSPCFIMALGRHGGRTVTGGVRADPKQQRPGVARVWEKERIECVVYKQVHRHAGTHVDEAHCT